MYCQGRVELDKIIIILSRKFEIDSFSEGLQMLGLLDIIENNKDVCYKLLCSSIKQTLTPNGFLILLDNSVEKPTNYAKGRCYD